jgi:hypothetical protein
LRVDFVHFVEVIHIIEENIDFHDFLQAAAGSLEDSRKVADHLMLTTS